MTIECVKCKYVNKEEHLFCCKCEAELWSAGTMLEKVQRKQLNLERRHKFELAALKSEIGLLSASLVNRKVSDEVKETHTTALQSEVKDPEIERVVESVKPPVEDPVVYTHEFEPSPVQINTIPEQTVPTRKGPTKLEQQIQSFLEPLHHVFFFFHNRV